MNSPAGSYSCSCNESFTLFSKNGTQGFMIAAGETGERHGDVYQLNHTCVREYLLLIVTSSHFVTNVLHSYVHKLNITILTLLSF